MSFQRKLRGLSWKVRTQVIYCWLGKERADKTHLRITVITTGVGISVMNITFIYGISEVFPKDEDFHENAKSTLDFVLQQADSTIEILQNVSGYLTAAKNVGISHVFLPRQLQTNIDNVNGMITTSANTLESATKKNKDNIFRYLDAVRLVLVVVLSVMLFLVYLGPFVSFMGPDFLIYVSVCFGWNLVATAFFLSGIYLVLHNAMGDACVAMHEWVDNPTAHTALDQIIPCLDHATSQEAHLQSKVVTIQMVHLVNRIIANVSNRNFPPNAGPLYYNQSGPLVPLLCNPYNPDRTDRMCAAGEVDLNFTQVYSIYECRVSENNICTTVGRLTPSLYDKVRWAANVSYGLHHYGPFLRDLADWTFVRNTLTTIYDSHCPGLSSNSQWVCIYLVILSTGLFLSMIIWVPYGQELRRVKPTSAQASD